MTVEGNADATAVDGTACYVDAADVEEVSVEQQEEKDGVGAFEGAPKSRDGIARRVLRGAQARLGVLVLVFAFVATAGVTSWLYAFQYRADHQTDADAAKAACTAASDGTVAILSYTPETLEKDFGAAKLRLTGNFLDYYTRFTEQIVTPAAKQKSVRTKATIVQAATAEIHPGAAVALVFVNQTTTSKENPDGAFTASSVKVGLTKVDGTWLISSFDPE